MAKQTRPIGGRVVAITGGARGIGEATATELTRRGARVAIGDLDLELAEKTAEELGGGAVAIQLDVTDRDSFANFLDETERQLGPVDVLINNAGIMPLGRFVEEDDLTAQRMVDINIHGVIFGTKLALERMEPRNSGHIVNIASQAGKAGFPGGATYCATKHAVVGLSEAVRAELDGTDIQMSVVMPGVVKTELASGLVEARGVKNLEPGEVAEAIAEALETGRFEVWIPRSTKAINTFFGLVPRRGREAMAKMLRADKILAAADPTARADYERRAAESEPGLEPDSADAKAAAEQ
ncbi:MAG TPA: SDR family oxidoreductase [Solirubrobacterales bacterium]|nr:SDR family oxidoreductase [Solirubrobacterales bacterium]